MAFSNYCKTEKFHAYAGHKLAIYFISRNLFGVLIHEGGINISIAIISANNLLE